MINHYYRPQTLAEAEALKAQHGDTATWIAGGAWLNHQPHAEHLDAVISLEALELNQLTLKGDRLIIGAMSCLQDLADNAELPAILRTAIELIPSRNLRNQGTLGGEIGANNPDSPLLPLLIAQEAALHLADGRQVGIEQYLADASSALICAIELPARQIAAVHCLRPCSQGLPAIWGALALNNNDPRLVLGGASEHICRWPTIEQAIAKKMSGDELEALVSDSVKPTTDIRGSSAYKRYLAGVVVNDLVQQVQQEA